MGVQHGEVPTFLVKGFAMRWKSVTLGVAAGLGLGVIGTLAVQEATLEGTKPVDPERWTMLRPPLKEVEIIVPQPDDPPTFPPGARSREFNGHPYFLIPLAPAASSATQNLPQRRFESRMPEAESRGLQSLGEHPR